jgi:hypothetical protein
MCFMSEPVPAPTQSQNSDPSHQPSRAGQN